MLRRLRLKFVAVNMVIVTLLPCVLFALLYRSTQADLEQIVKEVLGGC